MTKLGGSLAAVPAGSWRLGQNSGRVELATHMFGSSVRVVFDQVDGVAEVGSSALDSAISMSIAAASLKSGNRRRDDHLRSHLGLDVRRFPIIAFTGSAVGVTDMGGIVVAGDLVLRGQEVPLTLTVEVRDIDDCCTGLFARSEIPASSLGIGLGLPFARRLLRGDVQLSLTAFAAIDHCAQPAA